MSAGDRVGAIIVAAGSSRRMGGVDKIFAPVAGEPLLARVVDVFQNCPAVDDIVLVLGRSNLQQGRQLVRERGWSKVVAVCLGGARRQDSARRGLERLSGCDWVVLHDAARPCVTSELIERGLKEARASGCAVAAVPVTDTIKIVSTGGFIQQTPQRRTLWAAQTPQVFPLAVICEALSQNSPEASDDSMLVEQLGYKVKAYMGSYDNIKVTTPEDLALVEILWTKIHGGPPRQR